MSTRALPPFVFALPLAVSALASFASSASADEPAKAPASTYSVGAGVQARLVPVGVDGWARSSVNAVSFRGSSLATQGKTQYIAFYDGEGRVVLGKRLLGAQQWETKATAFRGNVKDAHNAISIGVDGSGVLHLSWDMHNQALRYARAKAPGSLELGEPEPMTGLSEDKVTYPQFIALRDGGLAFLFREGSSGDGDVVLNRYDLQARKWQPVARPLVDGEGKRNAYVNGLTVDGKGGWHLSWVWRETPDVATNHDVCYAFSPDEGRTWQKSSGEKYALPITEASAEVAAAVPQGSELINQTSMTVDSRNLPLVATYWRAAGTEVPQFQLVWHDGQKWRVSQVASRTQPFRLSGGGTRRIPISRPQVLAGAGDAVYVLFRDEERGNGASIAISNDPERREWSVLDVVKSPLGAWEPTYDVSLWQRERKLSLFVQNVGQGQGETLEEVAPQPVSVLEWAPTAP